MAVSVVSLVTFATGQASYIGGGHNLTTATASAPQRHYVIGGGYSLTSGGRAEASCEEAGYHSISTFDECRSAALAAGVRVKEMVGPGTWSWVPRGCSVQQGNAMPGSTAGISGKVHFSTSPGTNNKNQEGGYVLICKTAASDCSITDYGAVPDNRTVNTAAIQGAIDACHAAYPQGSRVVVPAGAFKTGSLVLRSNLELHLQKGAGLFGSEDWAEYPVVPGLPFGTMFRALVSGYNLTNVKVTGSNDAVPGSDSIIDGVGWSWWCIGDHMPIKQSYCSAFNPTNKTLPHGLLLPKLVEFFNCTGVTVADFTAQNSPFWTIVPTFSRNVMVQRMTVLNPREVGQTDGVDPDSCVDCVVEDCFIDVGDDGVSIKAYNVRGVGPAPCANVTVRRTKVLSRNICVGGTTEGGVSNILFEDVSVGSPTEVTSPWAIKFKVSAGVLSNITFRRLQLGKIGNTPWMYPHSAPGQAFYLDIKKGKNGKPAPTMEGLTFEDISVVSVKSIGHISGDPTSCIKGLTFRNITVDHAGSGWGGCGNVDLGSFHADSLSHPLKCKDCPTGLLV